MRTSFDGTDEANEGRRLRRLEDRRDLRRSELRAWGLLLTLVGLGLLGLALILSCTGCTAFGANPGAPTALERKLFDVETNFTPLVVARTNYVTNVVPVTVTQVTTAYVTNQVGVVQVVTNVVPVTAYLTNVVPVTQTVTNLEPSYTLTDKAGTATTVGLGATVANLVVPGSGGLLTLAVTALLGAWKWARSSKLADTSGALVQEIETIREFVKTLPNGAVYDSQLTQFLQQHQNEAGVAAQVVQLLEGQISNPDAKVAAQSVITSLNALKAIATPLPAVNAGT